MVIDLESVAHFTTTRLPTNFHNVDKTCTAEAFDAAGCFTALSDMDCIGLLLEEANYKRQLSASFIKHGLGVCVGVSTLVGHIVVKHALACYADIWHFRGRTLLIAAGFCGATDCSWRVWDQLAPP